MIQMTRAKRTYKAIVADSHNLFRRGLVSLVSSEADMEVIGEATSVSHALELAGPHQAEVRLRHAAGLLESGRPESLVLVIDIGLVAGDPEAIRCLREISEAVGLLLLAREESPDWLRVTETAGARGYMLKSAPCEQIIAGMRQAGMPQDTNEQGLSKQAPDLYALAENERHYSRTSPLTTREQEVVTMLAEGRTVREVAAELSLSIKTIEAHKLNLMRKLDIHNRANLVEYAVRSGLVSAQPVAR